MKSPIRSWTGAASCGAIWSTPLPTMQALTAVSSTRDCISITWWAKVSRCSAASTRVVRLARRNSACFSANSGASSRPTRCSDVGSGMRMPAAMGPMSCWRRASCQHRKAGAGPTSDHFLDRLRRPGVEISMLFVSTLRMATAIFPSRSQNCQLCGWSFQGGWRVRGSRGGRSCG